MGAILLLMDNVKKDSEITEVLEKHYGNVVRTSHTDGIKYFMGRHPDLIVVDTDDYNHDVVVTHKHLNLLNSQKEVPIVLTLPPVFSLLEAQLLSNGVDDVIFKPLEVEVFRQRVRRILAHERRLRLMVADLSLKSDLMEEANRVLVNSLTAITEGRDMYTGGHLNRTVMYVQTLLDEALKHEVYPQILSKEYAETVIQTTPLHDIGKVGISDIILNKTGPLTEEEFEIMKNHAKIGGDVLELAFESPINNGSQTFFTIAKDVAMRHHEHWDGRGYPDGMQYENIPLSGRIVAVADVYDALVTERPYKKAFTPEKAAEIIMNGSGTQFDPVLVDMFKLVMPRFAEISVAG
jgi:putative two-component system response regulator